MLEVLDLDEDSPGYRAIKDFRLQRHSSMYIESFCRASQPYEHDRELQAAFHKDITDATTAIMRERVDEFDASVCDYIRSLYPELPQVG